MALIVSQKPLPWTSTVTRFIPKPSSQTIEPVRIVGQHGGLKISHDPKTILYGSQEPI
jgi:hypothetical protein